MNEREQRAHEQYVTLFFVGRDLIIQMDDGDRHVIQTHGIDAEDCSCPDRQKRGEKCKHMWAWERWFVDRIVYEDGQVVDL